jgi:hypothetical protein
MQAESDTDFQRIAAELRDEAERAARVAALRPEHSDALRRKARDLARAAERIEEDANARESYVLPDAGEAP